MNATIGYDTSSETRRTLRTNDGMLDLILFLIIPGGVAYGCFRLGAWLFRTRVLAPHDVLRYGLALLPAALFILYFVKVAAEVALDPTSHNLWPFEMAFLLMFWAAYLTGMRIALGIAGYFIPTRI